MKSLPILVELTKTETLSPTGKTENTNVRKAIETSM